MAVSGAGLFWGMGMILSNVVITPLDRTIYGTQVASGGGITNFQCPFFLEFVMFLAMMACLLLEIPGWRRQAVHRGFLPKRHICIKLLIPALCDLLGSWFMFGGAMWVPASIVEMLGCSNTVFTAMLSICFLKKTIARYEWIGIGFSILGIIAVGVAHLATPNSTSPQNSEESSGTLTILGLLFVVTAHFWYAVEFVVTEKLLADHELSAFLSVGVMGVWGTLIFIPLFVLLQFTPQEPSDYAPMWHEEIGGSLLILARMPALLFAVLALFVALFFFNAAAFKTTEHLSAMARVVIGSVVSPLVWVLDLALAAVAGNSAGAAEKLSIWSSLQLVGFMFILGGTLIYNEVYPFRCGSAVPSAAASTGVSLVGDSG